MVADLAGRLALGGQLAQLGEGGGEVAIARLNNQGVIGRVGHGESGHQQLAAQGDPDEQSQPA